jgi:hypothetical protein
MAPKAKPSHPPFVQMFKEIILAEAAGRKGCSLPQLKKGLAQRYHLDDAVMKKTNLYLKKAVASGKIHHSVVLVATYHTTPPGGQRRGARLRARPAGRLRPAPQAGQQAALAPTSPRLTAPCTPTPRPAA